MKISIGNDHAGPDYKKEIIFLLESRAIKLKIMELIQSEVLITLILFIP